MNAELEKKFTKYEIARVIGARALQIAMDAPLLIKISEDELKKIHFDALKIAEMEFERGALPITINRPLPLRRKEKHLVVKEEAVSDEELSEKEKEVEKEIIENPEEYTLVKEDVEEVEVAAPAAEEQ